MRINACTTKASFGVMYGRPTSITGEASSVSVAWQQAPMPLALSKILMI